MFLGAWRQDCEFLRFFPQVYTDWVSLRVKVKQEDGSTLFECQLRSLLSGAIIPANGKDII